MLPHEAAQMTAAFALNGCVRPEAVAALAGVITIGDVTVATVEASVPLLDLAVMVQDVAIKGAVKSPVAEMVPQEVAKVALLLAVNCCVPPSLTVGLCGEITNADGTETMSNPYTV
jgi:hypothetical protein